MISQRINHTTTLRKWWFIAILCILLYSSIDNVSAQSEPLPHSEGIATNVPVLMQSDESLSVDQVVEAYVNQFMDSYDIPGFVISIVHNGTIVMNQAYGYAHLEQSIPMTVTTPIRQGSVSKPVLASALLQAEQEGILSLDDKFSQYSGDLTQYQSFDFTLGDLLLHRAGFEDSLLNVHTRDVNEYTDVAEYLQQSPLTPAFESGKIMSYSSYDYTLAGYALQVASGMTWDHYIQSYLFNVLNMTSSTFSQPQPSQILDNLAQGYDTSSGKAIPVPHDYTYLGPGVALVSSSSDMAQYMLMLLNQGNYGGNQFLSNASIDDILYNIHRDAVYLRGASYAFTEFHYANKTILYHNGNGIGSASRLSLAPDQQMGVYMSANSRALAPDRGPGKAATFINGLEQELISHFLADNRARNEPRQPLPDATSRASAYEGIYIKASTIGRENILKIEGMLDQLTVSDNGDGTITIGSNTFHEIDDGVFQHLDYPDWFYAFIRDSSGKIQYLTGGGTASYIRTDKSHQDTTNFASLALVLLSVLPLVIFALRSDNAFTKLSALLGGLVFVHLVTLIAVLFTVDALVLFHSTPLSIILLTIASPLLISSIVVALMYYTYHLIQSRDHVSYKNLVALIGYLLVSMLYISFILRWHILP